MPIENSGTSQNCIKIGKPSLFIFLLSAFLKEYYFFFFFSAKGLGFGLFGGIMFFFNGEGGISRHLLRGELMNNGTNKSFKMSYTLRGPPIFILKVDAAAHL